MKKVIAGILISAAGLGFATVSTAATSQEKTIFKISKENAAADHKLAREKCSSLAGNPKSVCMKEADAARTRTTAEAEAHYKNTPRARASARTAIANAEYDVAKTKCSSQTGNDKDVCIKEAKAANIAAKADATADKKVTIARKDAQNDKLDANYQVVIEKCDAFAGTAKDNCVASAKAQFGK